MMPIPALFLLGFAAIAFLLALGAILIYRALK